MRFITHNMCACSDCCYISVEILILFIEQSEVTSH